MAFVSGAPLPLSSQARTTRGTCSMRADDGSQKKVMSRRAALSAGLAAMASAAVSVVLPANAEREYANVGFLGGGDVIDVNNANVRVYQKLAGMYPTLAGKIVANGPYKSVDELYKLPDLTANQKALLDKYKGNLTALEPAAEYVIDKFNNGLYR